MKRYLPFVPVLALLVLGTALVACSSSGAEDAPPGDSDAAADGDAAAGDGPGVSAVCAPGFEDCEDMIVVGEGDDPSVPCGEGATDPECLEGDPPPALDDVYDVRVEFDRSVTQDDIDRAVGLVRDADPDAEVAILERFPPAAQARIHTGDAEACAILTEQLMNAPAVADVSCGPARDELPIDPDEPVTNP